MCPWLHMNYLQYCGARAWQQGILWRAPTPWNFVLGTSLSLRSPPHSKFDRRHLLQKRTARQLWTSKNERIGRLIEIFYTRITNWQLFTRTTELKLSGFYRIYSNGNFKIGNGLTTQSFWLNMKSFKKHKQDLKTGRGSFRHSNSEKYLLCNLLYSSFDDKCQYGFSKLF